MALRTPLDQCLKKSKIKSSMFMMNIFLRVFSCAFRFRPAVVSDIIRLVLKEILTDKLYNSEEAKIWTREISDSLQNKLKGACLGQIAAVHGLELEGRLKLWYYGILTST